MSDKSILLSTAYFAPIQYYSKFISYDTVYIEQFENFMKQTFRNRAVILGGNGPITLVVPVLKGRGPKILLKDMKIAYELDWQRNHWRSIFSAYNSSPYFEFYEDEIRPFFEMKFNYLLDFNNEINKVVLDCLEIEKTIHLTKDFEKVPDNTDNFREIISPKNKNNPDKQFVNKSYTQVFSERFGFIPNLSILDLLFNEGPNSYTILEISTRV